MINRKSGYVYAIQFENGAIKVGMTKHPRHRISQYGRYCRIIDSQIKSVWISPKVIDAAFEERQMIRNCLEWNGKIIRGKEWFSGIDFDEVVQHTSLFMEIASDEDLRNEKAMIDAHISTAVDRFASAWRNSK